MCRTRITIHRFGCIREVKVNELIIYACSTHTNKINNLISLNLLDKCQSLDHNEIENHDVKMANNLVFAFQVLLFIYVCTYIYVYTPVRVCYGMMINRMKRGREVNEKIRRI